MKGLVHVDASRQYLCGHSMGGYGAWHIAHASADAWAALGIHAGALQYDPREVDATVATALRDLPTYFVVGSSDGLLGVNQNAYGLLRSAGNPELVFVTFPEATTTGSRTSSACTCGCASSTTAAGVSRPGPAPGSLPPRVERAAQLVGERPEGAPATRLACGRRTRAARRPRPRPPRPCG